MDILNCEPRWFHFIEASCVWIRGHFCRKAIQCSDTCITQNIMQVIMTVLESLAKLQGH